MDEEAEARARRVARRRRTQSANPFVRVQAAAAASRAQAQRLLRPFGLSILEWRVLWDLHEAGPLTVRDLAAIQRADHSLISRALPAMRARGLVTAVGGARDRRRTLVSLTAAGAVAYGAAAPTMRARRAVMSAGFTEREHAALLDLLARYEAGLGHAQTPEAP